MKRIWVVAMVLAALGVAGCARDNPTYGINQPSFHSAGPGAQDEIQAVLDSQAGSIVTGDWTALLEMYIPTERARCTLASFTEASEQSYSGLRVRAQGKLTAKVSGLHLDGFRASVDYQFVLPVLRLATMAQTSHYLKLGDRWFIDEKAC